MCGIIGIYANKKNNHNNLLNDLLIGLQLLNHRGQDGAGLSDGNDVYKNSGAVYEAFKNIDREKYLSHNYIGQVRYATNNVKDSLQPFYLNIPIKTFLCHNGNIINIKEIKEILYNLFFVKTTTNSDSELILILFNVKLLSLLKNINKSINFSDFNFLNDYINKTIEYLHTVLKGSYNLLILIENYGLIVVRDPSGIRPLIWGYKNNTHIIASESIVCDQLDYKIKRDIKPGETCIFTQDNITQNGYHYYLNSTIDFTPCLFEYLYFARPDSVIDEINVYEARIKIGEILGKIINREKLNIDYIVPIPHSGITFALGIQNVLNLPMAQGFIKNNYTARTFILNKKDICKSIKNKYTCNKVVFNNKNVLLVDDSIVRGNTSKYLVEKCREAGVNNIYLCSGAPIINNINNYGINVNSKEELVFFNRDIKEVERYLNVNKIIFNDLDSIIALLKTLNTKIKNYEISLFTE